MRARGGGRAVGRGGENAKRARSDCSVLVEGAGQLGGFDLGVLVPGSPPSTSKLVQGVD